VTALLKKFAGISKHDTRNLLLLIKVGDFF